MLHCFTIATMHQAAEVCTQIASKDEKRLQLEQIWADAVHHFLVTHGCLCETSGCFAKQAREVQISLVEKTPFSLKEFLFIIDEGMKLFSERVSATASV